MCDYPRPPGRRQERLKTEENRLTGIYGDHIKKKGKGMMRILFQNPQELGPIYGDGTEQSLKITKLKETLLKHNIDILGLSEINKDWRLIPQKETWWHCTEGWFEHRRLGISHNKKVAPVTHTQFGGTLLMSVNKAAYRVGSIEADARQLGRWTSMLIKGKNTTTCRVICAYCPCYSNGPSSTYAMQVVGLARQNITECPRKMFWQDLQAYIVLQCQAANENVVIMGDWNSSYKDVAEWMHQFNLHDGITGRHSHTTPPATCVRSRGAPIDAIFIPSQFQCWRGGYFAFDYLEGDHRGIWCDIPAEFILGYQMQHPAHPKARRLKTTDPKVRKKYVQHLDRLLKEQKVYDKLEQLWKDIQNRVLPTDILQFEEMDEIITNAMMVAERSCRKLKTGIVKWSPLYQQACDRVTYWMLVQKESTGQRVNVRKIRSLRKKLKLNVQALSSDEITSHLRTAITNRIKCKKYAAELQMEYRHRLARDKEAEDNIPAAVHIRNLTHQEHTRTLFRRIRYLERKIQNLSTSRLTVTNKQGQVKELTHKDLIERTIIQANEAKYHQTDGYSQLQKGQLLKDIGHLGIGPRTSQILNGTYKPPYGTTKATKAFLEAMKRPDQARPIPHISFQEFYKGWSKAKERTSSNGPHFGHYKAALYHSKISKLLYQRALIPMMTGYSPKRHREGMDVMLLKKENSHDVDSLRTIVLFDSEANMNYKHLGRRAMKAAVELNQIAAEQYSRPNRKAIDHAINRRLVMDHQLYCRQPYAMTSCDLKSCYDRITHAASSLSLQRIGISKTEVTSMFESIQRMRHKVRTSFGDSVITYGGNWESSQWKTPPQGVLQGNGSGPAIWSILSSIIFQILHKQSQNNTICSPIRQQTLDLIGFAYVDDADLLRTGNTVAMAAQRMQNTVQLWMDNIRTTGGTLAPAKCWWYLIDFIYKSGRWKASSSERVYQLWMKPSQHKRIEVKNIPASQSMNMLGVYMAPDGNTRDHVRYLRSKAEQWATNMRQASRNIKQEVWVALHRTIPFVLGYSLPAVTLTADECRYIMAPINRTGLSLSGISSTVPTPIRTGPIRFGGLDLCDLYISMGVRQIETFISHTWAQTPTGKLLEITMDDFALEMGLASPWQHNRLEMGLQYTTTPSWIRHMFQFSMANKIRIHKEVPFFGKQRENDRLIMELATDWTRDVSCLKSINNVRMYLKVVWLSDITTADGRIIDCRSLSRQSKFPVRNAYRWPLKHTTTRQDWRRWKQWIRTLCRNEEYNFIQPLGQWQVSQEDWVQYWDCFLHTSGELLYMKMPHETFWRRQVVKSNRRRHHHRQFYKEYLQCQILPETGQFLLRANATHFANYVELTAQANLLFQEILQEEQRPTWSNIRATKHSVITAITNTLNPVYIETSDSLDLLFRDFTQGTIIAVSDGSHQPTTNGAAAAWIVESECRSQWILGTINTPGPLTAFSAYRSELIGLTAISVTLKVLANCLQQPRHVIIGCDGKSALHSLLLNHEDITANTKNADLLAINADIWTSVQMSPYLVHVKGHQDTSGKELRRMEKMNVLMDRAAFLTALYTPNQGDALHIPSVGMTRITYNGRFIEGQLAKTLYDGIVSDRLKNYYDLKLFDGKNASLNQVCLAAFHYARNHATTGLNIFVSKWLSDTLATGIVMQKRKHRIFNRCPRCNHWGEDKWHIVVCWDVRAKVIWDKKLKELQHFMNNENTKPDIAEFIMTGLTHYRNRPNREPPNELENWRQEQVGIGWDNFISGFVSNELVIHQAEHFRTIGTRKSGKTWAGKLILQVWNLIHNLWLGRNEVLHQKDTINSISGETLLDIEIEREYDAGCENLPTVIHPWYRQTKQQLLAQSTEYKKGWLLMV